MLAFVTSATKTPTKTGTNVPHNELKVPPVCINAPPLLPPPPRVFNIGFTTVFNIHIEKPATNAPIRYIAKLPAPPDKY